MRIYENLPFSHLIIQVHAFGIFDIGVPYNILPICT